MKYVLALSALMVASTTLAADNGPKLTQDLAQKIKYVASVTASQQVSLMEDTFRCGLDYVESKGTFSCMGGTGNSEICDNGSYSASFVLVSGKISKRGEVTIQKVTHVPACRN